MKKAFIINGVLYVIDRNGHIRIINKETELGVYLEYYWKLWYAHMSKYVDSLVDNSKIPDGVQYEISDKKLTLI